jgi:hypothetical protein
MRVVVVLLALAACERDEPVAVVPHDAAVLRDAPAPVPVVPACRQAASTKIDNGHCDQDADCVLTTRPADCNACDFAEDYPTLKAAVDQRNARCGPTSCATGCPKHDWYINAFYRPECRGHRCIAWRYHSGG